jgi:CheY-like chemotaxis protein
MIAKAIIERNNHFTSTSFGDTQDAIEYLSNCIHNQQIDQLPAIIFLDLDMPLMSGWDFLDTYASLTNEVSGQLPYIYILSSSINPRDYSRAKNHPLVKDMLTKPLTYQIVNEVLNTHLLSPSI